MEKKTSTFTPRPCVPPFSTGRSSRGRPEEDCSPPSATRNALQGLRLHHHEARHRDEEARAQKPSCSPYAFKGSKDKAWAYAPTRAHGNCPFLANALPSLPHAHCRTQPRPPRLMPQPASPKLFLCCATTDSPPSIGWRDQLATSAGRTQGTRRNTSRSTSPTPPVSPPSPKTTPTPALSSVPGDAWMRLVSVGPTMYRSRYGASS